MPSKTAKQPDLPGLALPGEGVKKTKLLVSAQIDKLPDWIKVGGNTIRIQRFHTEDFAKKSCWGHYRASDQVLLVNDESPSLNHLGSTLLHEVQHAIWDAYRIEALTVGAEDTEEVIVDVGSLGLWQVARDNPWFLPWIQDCLRFDHNPPVKE